MNKCPKEPRIPIYLFVTGCVGVFKSFVIIWKHVQKHSYTSENKLTDIDKFSHLSIDFINETELVDVKDTTLNKGSTFINRLLSIFLIIWYQFEIILF